jgi:hypothetical protein
LVERLARVECGRKLLVQVSKMWGIEGQPVLDGHRLEVD